MEDVIELYTDGACSGNPGKGGYGVVLKYKNFRQELSDGFELTTNNRMELLAVIIGLESIKDKNLHVKIFSDSRYVVDTMNDNLLHKWAKQGYKHKQNIDLWQRLRRIYNKYLHQFIWVKGHADNVENNRCDELAVAACKKKELKIDSGYNKVENNLFDFE